MEMRILKMSLLLLILGMSNSCTADRKKEAEDIAQKFCQAYWTGDFWGAMEYAKDNLGEPVYFVDSQKKYFKETYPIVPIDSSYVYRHLGTFYAPCRYNDRLENIDKYAILYEVKGRIAEMVIVDEGGELKIRSSGHWVGSFESTKTENLENYKKRVNEKIKSSLAFKNRSK